VIRITLIRKTTLAMSPAPTLLILRLLALLSRAVATPVGRHSFTPRPSAMPVTKWVTSALTTPRTFPETAVSLAKSSVLFQTQPRMLLLLALALAPMMLWLAPDACSDLPPLLQIAGVTTTMTLAGKAYSSLTSLTNLTSLKVFRLLSGPSTYPSLRCLSFRLWLWHRRHSLQPRPYLKHSPSRAAHRHAHQRWCPHFEPRSQGPRF